MKKDRIRSMKELRMKHWYFLLGIAFLANTGSAKDLAGLLTSNTIHETRQDGTQSWFTFDKDYSFHMRSDDGKTSSGTWQLTATGEVCISPQGAPADAPKPCLLIKDKGIGDGWDRLGPNGRKEHFAIESGRSNKS
jgi:hypothetical protein